MLPLLSNVAPVSPISVSSFWLLLVRSVLVNVVGVGVPVPAPVAELLQLPTASSVCVWSDPAAVLMLALVMVSSGAPVSSLWPLSVSVPRMNGCFAIQPGSYALCCCRCSSCCSRGKAGYSARGGRPQVHDIIRKNIAILIIAVLIARLDEWLGWALG